MPNSNTPKSAQLEYVLKPMNKVQALKIYVPNDGYVTENDPVLSTADGNPEELVRSLFEKFGDIHLNKSCFYADGVDWFDKPEAVTIKGKTSWVIKLSKVVKWLDEGNQLIWEDFRKLPQMKNPDSLKSGGKARKETVTGLGKDLFARK